MNQGVTVVGIILTLIGVIYASSKYDDIKTFVKGEPEKTEKEKESNPEASNDTTPKNETPKDEIPANEKSEETLEVLMKILQQSMQQQKENPDTIITDESGKTLIDLGKTNLSDNVKDELKTQNETMTQQKTKNTFSSDPKNIKVDESIVLASPVTGHSDTGNFIGGSILKAGTGLSQQQIANLSLGDLIKFGYAKSATEAKNIKFLASEENKKLTDEGRFGTNTGKNFSEKLPTVNKAGQTKETVTQERASTSSSAKDEQARKAQMLFNALYPTIRSDF